MAVDQVVQAGIRDQRQIVQFQDVEMFRSAGSGSQLADALVGDEFTMRKAEGF